MDEKISSPLKLTVHNDVLGILDRIALRIREDIRQGRVPPRGPGRSVGASTVASNILERLVRERPEILEEWYPMDGHIIEEQKEKASPKAGSGRRAKQAGH